MPTTAIEELMKFPALLRAKQVKTATGLTRRFLLGNGKCCLVFTSEGGCRYYSRDKLIELLQGKAVARADATPQEAAGTPRHRTGTNVV